MFTEAVCHSCVFTHVCSLLCVTLVSLLYHSCVTLVSLLSLTLTDSTAHPLFLTTVALNPQQGQLDLRQQQLQEIANALSHLAPQDILVKKQAEQKQRQVEELAVSVH